jgi:hypothetical protein
MLLLGLNLTTRRKQMLQLTDIDKTKLSEPVSNILNELELKHAKMQYCLTVSAVQNTHREEFWQLRFHDPRFIEEDESIACVGIVEWAYGSRSEKEYKITSRKIRNERYGHWGNEHSSRRTKDMKKAVKIAMEAMQPYEYHEVSAKGRRDAERAHEQWARASASATSVFGIGHDKMYEEIKYLVSTGVKFKTDAFKNAAAGIEAYEEFQRKLSIRARFHTIIQRPDKLIYIPDGRALEPQEFGALEALPENTRNGIALLKLVEKDKLLPEVGYRAGENTYFILV